MSAGFAASLHADMYDIGSARAYYRMAIGRARQVGQNLLAEYMLGSLAAFEIEGRLLRTRARARRRGTVGGREVQGLLPTAERC